jgi:RNA polymerase sigma-70 factor (ECF subfamily)
MNPTGMLDASQARATPRRQCSAHTAAAPSRRRQVTDESAPKMRDLYQAHATELWRYAVRLTGDRARAQDVVQETLLKAWQHPEVTGDPARSPRAWLFTVARNIIIDDHRSARSRNESVIADPDRLHDRAGPDETNSALDRLLLSSALAQLNPDHRTVIRRSYYEGWTTAQIAADLGIPEGTVRSRLHYAMRALRLTLQEMGCIDTRNSQQGR